jgi:hypothetical protein
MSCVLFARSLSSCRDATCTLTCVAVLLCTWWHAWWLQVAYDEIRARPLEEDDPSPLSFPFNRLQGPIGSVPIARSWMYSFYWSSTVISGMITFDITPQTDGMLSYVLCVICKSTLPHTRPILR